MKNLKIFALLSAMLMVMVGCTKTTSEANEALSVDPDNPTQYIDWEISSTNIVVNTSDGPWVLTENQVRLFLHADIIPDVQSVQDSVGFVPADSLSRMGDTTNGYHIVVFPFNHGKFDTIKYNLYLQIPVTGSNEYIYVKPKEKIIFFGTHQVVENNLPNNEHSKTTYRIKDLSGDVAEHFKLVSDKFTYSSTAPVHELYKFCRQDHSAGWQATASLTQSDTLRVISNPHSIQLYSRMSDGSEVLRGQVNFNCVTVFFWDDYTGNFNSSVNNQTYTPNANGVFNCAGNNVTCRKVRSYAQASNFIVDGINLKDSIHICPVTVNSLYFNGSTSKKVITFSTTTTYQTPYNAPTRTRTGIEVAFQHIALSSNVATTSTTMTASCSNKAVVTETYNLAPLTETHNVSFNFHFPFTYSATGTLYQSNIGEVLSFTQSGNTFTATSNSGCVVTFVKQARTCDNVMYDGVNYKSQASAALGCDVNVLTGVITATGIDVTFKNDHNETVVGHINKNIAPDPIVPDDLWGTTHALYVSRSDRDDYGNGERWLHSLQENAGSWRIYSKRLDIAGGTWSYVSITATEAAQILANSSSTCGIAKVYDYADNNNTFMSMVNAYQHPSNDYDVQYWSSFAMTSIYEIRGNVGSLISGIYVTEHPVYSVDLTGNAGVFTVTYAGQTHSVQ